MYECKDCGCRTESTEKNCPVCGKEMTEVMTAQPSDEQPPVKKKKGGAIGAVITIIVIFASRLIGGFVGDIAGDKMMESSEKRDMDKFIKRVEEYTPGKLTDDGYASEFWGICWEPGDEWSKMADSELSAMSEGSKSEAMKSAEKALQSEGVSESLKEKFKSTIYGDVEAGYNYYVDEGLAGSAYMMVFSAYGIEKAENADVQFAEEFAARLENSTTGTATLGGKKYEYAEGIYREGINTVNMRVYVRVEGVMVSMMQVLYADGNEKLVESFENSIASY